MNPYRFLLLCLCFLPFAAPGQSPAFKYKLGYFGFFDNREYFNPYVNDQTIFGSRLSGELGVSLNSNNSIMAGADFLYEFGSKGELIAPDIIMYYNGSRKNLDFYLGAFPRLQKVNMPLALMTDTFQYYRPTVEGILLDYSTPAFRQNVWLDWTGRQSEEKREMFMLGFSGWLDKGLLMARYHFVMSHLAHTSSDEPGQHLRDNGGYSALVGVNLSQITRLDTLSISTGLLGSYDRLRGVYDFTFPVGWLSELVARYRGFGLHGTFYTGESQTILSGDGFYKSTFYTRADAYYEVSSAHIQGRLQFSFHFVPDIMDLSMSLLIRADIEGVFGRHH